MIAYAKNGIFKFRYKFQPYTNAYTQLMYMRFNSTVGMKVSIIEQNFDLINKNVCYTEQNSA